jgi:hypothetical protein
LFSEVNAKFAIVTLAELERCKKDSIMASSRVKVITPFGIEELGSSRSELVV